jgi:predicted ATP-binding protein involved in virulence
MRIDRLEIKNFKKFSDYTLELHPQFTLLVGDNGTGKTTLLDALAVAAGVWLVNSPDTTLNNSRRNILPSEIRLEAIAFDSIIQLIELKPVQITATGVLDGRSVQWLRQIKSNGSRTSNTGAKAALEIISSLFQQVAAGAKIWLPIVAYYGAGRAWLPSNQRDPKAIATKAARRWDAFYDCFEERIRIADIQNWFQKEAIASVNRQGRVRPGYKVVELAILNCIPNADAIWFEPNILELVVSIDRQPQPFSNLSAGQKMMVALVADIAIKIVTQNASFLTENSDDNGGNLPLVLQQTSGLVLIDEIDVHLHPKWQHQVVNDLTRTFPSIQFVCTSHSPLIIGEVEASRIRILEGDSETHASLTATIPTAAYGLDANRVLDELMGATDRNRAVAERLHTLFELIDTEDFAAARQTIATLSDKLGESEPELTRARSLIKFLAGNE